MRILEKNGIDNTNIDGAGFNRFCAGDRDGIVKGRLNECAIAVQGNALTIGTGEMLVSGFRVVLDTPTTFTMSSTPTSAQRYQVIAEIVVDGNSEPTFEMRTQLVAELKQDALFATDAGVGTYQIEVCRFTHATDGTISEMSRTVDIITGGSGMELEVGTVETKTVANTEPAAVTVTTRAEGGKTYLDFGYDIPRGADGVTPRIGDNKHWYIGEEDTGIVAEGKDGATPEIGENGNWFVNGEDTGKPSKGAKGDDGKSVTSATAGATSQEDGYTVTPVTFGLSDGSSLPAVPIKAKSTEVVANPSRDTDNRLAKIDINGTIYNIARIINAVDTVSQIYETNLVVGDSVILPRDIVSNTGDLVVAKFENAAPSGGSGVLFALDEGDGPNMYTLLAVISDSAGGGGGGGLNATEISLESSKDAKEIYKTIKTLSETQKIVSILPGANYEGGLIVTTVKDGVTKTYVMIAPLFSWTNRGELEITGMLYEMDDSGTPVGTLNQATLLYYRTGDTDYPTLIRGGISYEDFENDNNSEKSATILASSYPLMVYSQEA